MTAKLDPFAAAPSLMKSWVSASVPIRAGLDPKLVALVESRASQLNGCAHCLNMHTKEAGRMPIATPRLSANSSCFGRRPDRGRGCRARSGR
jgi:AhpD family alkylhydroperoxidase